ncbi:MAG TPA: hypothetical protein VGN88_04900 [Phycisphaerae bacterium]
MHHRHPSIIPLAALAAAVAFAAAPAPTSQPKRELEPLTGIPQGTMQPLGDKNAGINLGTTGLDLPGTRAGGGKTMTIAILGDLSPADDPPRQKYLQRATDELNLLRPELVLTVGNLLPGLTRSGTRYAADVALTRGILDTLKMPWYPCPGDLDVSTGLRPSDLAGTLDTRFEAAYQKLLAPLYYSVDATDPDGGGGIHAIVLDTEEKSAPSENANSLSQAQLSWLAKDLDHTFEANRAQWVILAMHRPLWRMNPASTNWPEVQNLLTRFNSRPRASVEGMGAAGSELRGPRVVALFAGSQRAYSQDPPHDGLRFYVLGPTAASPKSAMTSSEALRQVMLVKFDSTGIAGAIGDTGEVHPALLQLTGGDRSALLPEDTVTLAERTTLDAIASWNEQTLGIDGIVDERGEPLGRRLTFHAANPLTEPVDIQLRLAAGGWEFSTPPFQRRLSGRTPGGQDARVAYEFSLRRVKAGTDLPVVEALVHWTDGRGRIHEMIHSRAVTVSPSVALPVADKPVEIDAPDGWTPAGNATAWISPAAPSRAGEPANSDPAIDMAADTDHLLLRVHVHDPVPSYWPSMNLDPQFGGIASDAVSIAWTRPDNQQVQRIWILPFAPPPKAAPPAVATRGASAPARGPATRGPQPATSSAPAPAPPAIDLWTNTGIGESQTPLQKLAPNSGIQAAFLKESAGYTVTFRLPRKLICEEIPAPPPPPPPPISIIPQIPIPFVTPETKPAVVIAPRVAAKASLNITVHNNDETTITWTKSWAREDAGLAAWARVELMQSPPSPRPDKIPAP